MKFSVLLPALLCCCFAAHAQAWTDAASLPLHGKAVEETATRYARLPASLADECRPPVWKLGQNSAGLYIRFRTDSPTLWVRWESATSHVMNHMSATGSRGLDLYVLSDGRWRFLTAARPELKKAVTERKLISDMEPQMREYMMYLSLYDGVSALEIGTEEGHPAEPAEVQSPRSGRPVVMYGTSITQGGCVSRPGMLYTSIMSRALDREFVNLGFSGNALFDLEIARLMASVPDPACFVIAAVENAGVEQIEERGEAFFRILRDAHPDVPVVFVQAVRYSHLLCDKKAAANMEQRMAAYKKLFDSLKKSGEKRIYFTDPAAKASFADAESSVDGSHLTDLGAMRFAEAVLPVLKKAIRK
jgi:lysophospholipase L1-like esterase